MDDEVQWGHETGKNSSYENKWAKETLKRHYRPYVSVYECQGCFVLRFDYPVEVYKDKDRVSPGS